MGKKAHFGDIFYNFLIAESLAILVIEHIFLLFLEACPTGCYDCEETADGEVDCILCAEGYYMLEDGTCQCKI